MSAFDHIVEILGVAVLVLLPGGYLLATLLRQRRLLWSWAALGLPCTYLLLGSRLFTLPIYGACLLACMLGAAWHHQDLDHGADIAEQARGRMGAARAALHERFPRQVRQARPRRRKGRDHQLLRARRAAYARRTK